MVTFYLKDAQPQLRQDSRTLSDRVRAMLDDIEQNRDAAVRRYAKELDRLGATRATDFLGQAEHGPDSPA